MKCVEFQKYVSAFADGELDVEQNLEALEHLNMCQRCAHRVADIQQLRSSLRKVLGLVAVPADLSSRIADAIDHEDHSSSTRSATGIDLEGGPLKSAKGRGLILRLNVILGAAAVLVVLIGLRDMFTDQNNGGVAFGQVVSEVQTRHRACAADGGVRHHAAALPRDQVDAARTLCEELDLDVRAPQLQDVGFEFVGADYCGVMKKRGAHLLYRSSKYGSMLSLFYVERLPEVEARRMIQVGQNECAMAKGASAVILWHEGNQSCIGCACGGLPETVFKQISERVQLARRDSEELPDLP